MIKYYCRKHLRCYGGQRQQERSVYTNLTYGFNYGVVELTKRRRHGIGSHQMVDKRTSRQLAGWKERASLNNRPNLPASTKELTMRPILFPLLQKKDGPR